MYDIQYMCEISLNGQLNTVHMFKSDKYLLLTKMYMMLLKNIKHIQKFLLTSPHLMEDLGVLKIYFSGIVTPN